MNRDRTFVPSGLCGLMVCALLWSLAGASTAQAATVEERLERLEQKTLSTSPGAQQETGNMVFFRGGWAGLVNDRGNEIFTDVENTFGTGSSNDNNNGYYVGAGLDLVLSRDVWGMMSGVWALGEIGVEFKRWNSERVAQAVPSTAATAFGNTTVNKRKVQLTMLTVSVAPKIMFMEGSRIRPWIIPAGLDFHVISPPSNDTTVLDIGVQWAVGVQYRVWKAIHLGIDGRFHLATGQTDTTNNFGTAGAYVGLAF
ncbi:MAG: hypothetical protein ACQ9IQ_06745 [Nitrospirales bacterium]